jgi:hypothetical protein
MMLTKDLIFSYESMGKSCERLMARIVRSMLNVARADVNLKIVAKKFSIDKTFTQRDFHSSSADRRGTDYCNQTIHFPFPRSMPAPVFKKSLKIPRVYASYYASRQSSVEDLPSWCHNFDNASTLFNPNLYY